MVGGGGGDGVIRITVRLCVAKGACMAVNVDNL